MTQYPLQCIHVNYLNMTLHFQEILAIAFLFRVHANMAASKALKDITDNLEEQLTCSLCLEVFTNPKTLPCLHSFCTRCIDQWFQKRGNPFDNELNCPMCKTTVVVPDGDPSKLPPSFYFDSLLQLLHAMKTKAPNQPELPCCVKCETTHVLVAFCAQCNGMICEACFNAHKLFIEVLDEHQPIMLNQFQQENVNSFIKKQMLCKKKFHEKERLKYYCQKCVVCICQTCAILDHQNHKMQSLQDAGQDSRKLIIAAMNRVEKRKENYEQELKHSKENIERIQGEISVAERDVDDAVKMICDMAKEHGRVMKTELRQTLQEQTTANDEEQTAIKTRLEESDVFVQQCQAILERDVPYEEIESKEMIQERSEILSLTASVLCGQPIKRNVTIHYSVTERVIQTLLEIGKIVRNVTDHTHSTLELLKTRAPRGFINEFKIITRNTEGELCPTRIESIDVRIKDEEGNEVEKKVFEKQPGKYSVSFQPQKGGQHEIQVKIGGQAIMNSPQKVDIQDVKELFKPVKTFGGKGSGRGQFLCPWSIAVRDNKEIAIADGANHCIQIFSPDGKYERHFGMEGTEEGHLYDPYGVVFNEDRIIVTDGPDGKGRIQEFDLNGFYVRTIYRHDQWFENRGMCVNDDGNIAVCCWGKQDLGIKPSIKVLNKQGHIFHEFDLPGNDKPPCYITYGNGKYFVSYPTNCVRVFDVNGVFLYKFREQGEPDGQFNGVDGLAVYSPDMILVCDGANDRVQLFTQEGQFIRSFGSCDSGVAQMENPVDVAVTADGRVFVVEYLGNRVSVWY